VGGGERGANRTTERIGDPAAAIDPAGPGVSHRNGGFSEAQASLRLLSRFGAQAASSRGNALEQGAESELEGWRGKAHSALDPKIVRD
jgi:hypothetical protein